MQPGAARHCWAYPLSVVRSFCRWQRIENCLPRGFSEAETAVLYVWDDLSVTTEPFADDPCRYHGDDAEWASFCAALAGFGS